MIEKSQVTLAIIDIVAFEFYKGFQDEYRYQAKASIISEIDDIFIPIRKINPSSSQALPLRQSLALRHPRPLFRSVHSHDSTVGGSQTMLVAHLLLQI